MTQTSTRICILGGGFGGLYTALRLSQQLRGRSPQLQMTLVDPKSQFLFTPLLYEQLTGTLQTWEIAPTYAELLANRGISFCHDRVQRVDLHRRQVILDSEQGLTYDYLVLAVGQQPRFDAVPGAASHALSFRTLADSDRLKQRLQGLAAAQVAPKIAIVGAGANGVELACNLADQLPRERELYLIEQRDTILSGFSVATQKTAYRALAHRNIHLKLETTIERVEINQIQLGQSQPPLPVDVVLWTTGTRSWDWLRSLPCQQTPQGQLRVRPTLQLIDYPEVFALGDAAFTLDMQGKHLQPSAQVAFQQATLVANNLNASLSRRLLKPFHFQPQGEMLTLGRGEAVVTTPKLQFTGWVASLLRHWIYLMRLPTWKHRLRVLRYRLQQWGRAGRSQPHNASAPLQPPRPTPTSPPTHQ